MTQKLTFANMGWNLIPVALASLFVLADTNVPEVEQKNMPAFQRDVSYLKESLEALPEKEEPTEETFEEKHKDEDVINLYFGWHVVVNEDYSYTETWHNKKKIMREDGKRYGELSLSYEEGKEEIVSIKAHTITPDGKKYDNINIHDMSIYQEYANYSAHRRKIVTFPQVNVGSIVEYEKVSKSKYGAVEGVFTYGFWMEFRIPTLKADFSISIPKSLNISCHAFILDQPTVINETDDRVIYSWSFVDVYSTEENEDFEPYPRQEDVKNIVTFSSIDEWSEVSDWYYAEVSKNSMTTPEIENAAEEMFSGFISIKDKVRALNRYINRKFRYVSMSFGANNMVPHRTDEVFINKYGDCKDLAVLCRVILKLAGIDSDIVLFTREADTVFIEHDLPDPGLFSHVLLRVHDPEGDFYFDPLLEGYDIGEYPISYQAGHCFVVNENGGYFDRFPVFDEMRGYNNKKSVIEITNDGMDICTIDSLWTLDFSIESRQMYADMREEEMNKFLKYLNAEYGEVYERKWENAGPEDYGQIKSYIKYKRKSEYEDVGGIMVIDIDPFDLSDGYFESKTRKKPIFFPTNAFDENVLVYKIPKGYRIEHMPEDVHLDVGFFKAERVYTVKGREITIERKNWNKRMEIPAEEYQKVKEFFNTLEGKTKQRIVLKKHTSWWRKIMRILEGKKE